MERLHRKSLSGTEFVLSILCVVVIGWNLGSLTMLHIGIRSGSVSGSSMMNTLSDGTRTLYISQHIKKIQRGDIVSFYGYADGTFVNIVKRIIALPEDRIRIDKEHVYVNGVLLDEPYAIYSSFSEDFMDITLRADEYFVLGDNRSESLDSRHFGVIQSKNILGVLIFTRSP